MTEGLDLIEYNQLKMSERFQLELSKLLGTVGLKSLSSALWNGVFTKHLTPAVMTEIACKKFGIRLVKVDVVIDSHEALVGRVDGLKLFFHRGTASDYGVLGQIFWSQDYDLSRLRRGDEILQIYSSLLRSGQKPLIIDAGANIGASVFWFAHHFPEGHICAFEPQGENFEFLSKNVQEIKGDIQVIKAAVGASDGFVDVVDEGQGECGFRTKISSHGETKLISLKRFLSEKISEGFVPFLVKIDIEGGEEQLFSGECQWMDCFPLIIIELHDWLIPRKRTSRTFLEFVSRCDRDFVYVGENIFSISNSTDSNMETLFSDTASMSVISPFKLSR